MRDVQVNLVSVLQEKGCDEPTSSDLDRGIGSIANVYYKLKKMSEIASYQMRFSCMKSLEGSLNGIREVLDDVAELLELESEWSSKPKILDYTRNSTNFDSLLVRLHRLDSQATNLIKRHFLSLPDTKSMIAIVPKIDQIIELNKSQCSFESEVQYFYKILDSRVEYVKEHFENRKARPPVIRGASRFSGALIWLRCLKSRLTESIRRQVFPLACKNSYLSRCKVSKACCCSVKNTFLQDSREDDWNAIRSQVDAFEAHERKWIHAWNLNTVRHVECLQGPIFSINQDDRTMTALFGENLETFLKDLCLLNKMMYSLPKSLEGPTKIGLQCLGRHHLVLNICNDLESLTLGHDDLIGVLEDNLMEWIFQAGIVMAETMSWASVSSESMMNEVQDRISTLRNIQYTLDSMRQDIRRSLSSIVDNSMVRILRFPHDEYSLEDFFSVLKGNSKQEIPILFNDL